MYLKLIREKPTGDAIFGRLYVDGGHLVMDTLENWQYAVPAGFYRLRLTYSPHFKELLPLLDRVIGFARNPHSGVPRTGIRIHVGNSIEDTTGCILVGNKLQESAFSLDGREQGQKLLSSRKCLEELREYLRTNQTLNPYEEMYIEITEPDAYPYADVECPRELQQHIIDQKAARERYFRLHPKERG